MRSGTRSNPTCAAARSAHGALAGLQQREHAPVRGLPGTINRAQPVRMAAGGAPHRLPSRSAAVHWRASGDMSMSSSMLISDNVGPGEEEASLTAAAAEAPALGSAGAASGGGATLSRTSTAACEARQAQHGWPTVGARRGACSTSRSVHTPSSGSGETAASARAMSQLCAGASVCGGHMRRSECQGACSIMTGCACILQLHRPACVAPQRAGEPRQDSRAAAPATHRTAPTRARRRPPTAAAACAWAAAAARS